MVLSAILRRAYGVRRSAPMSKPHGRIRQAPCSHRQRTGQHSLRRSREVMELAGFKTKYGTKGDIAIFTHAACNIRQTAAKPHHGPVLPVYVRDCLKALAQ